MLTIILNIIGGIGIVIGLVLYHIYTEQQDTPQQQHWLDKQIDNSMANDTDNSKLDERKMDIRMRGKEWE